MSRRFVCIFSRDSDIYIAFRNSDGSKTIEKRKFKPYFYYKCKNGKYRSIFGDRLCKRIVGKPSEITKLRDRYEHFEADIPYVRRFLIDSNFESDLNIELRKMYMDIEVEVLDSFPDVKLANRKVTSVCVYDSFACKYFNVYLSDKDEKRKRGDVVYLSVDDELKLLKIVTALFRKVDPDVVLAWNISFDMTYLRNRLSKFNMKLPGLFDEFDLLEAYRSKYNYRSNRLREVAVREGLLKSSDAEYTDDIEKMREKNVEDVELIVKLDEKLDLSKTYLNIRDAVGLESSWKAFNNSVVIDTLLLKFARKRNIVLPSIPENVEIKKLKGALVLTPPKGVFESVCVFDISSCYPNTIITFNMSPETLCECSRDCYKLSNGVCFKRRPRGLLVEVCEELLKRKYDIEDKMKQLDVSSVEYKLLEKERVVNKYLVNAVYGYLTKHKYGSVSRLYSYEVASSITHMAREYLTVAKKYLEDKGIRVVYADTDGLFVVCPFDKAHNVVSELNDFITEYLKSEYDVEESTIRFDFSDFYERILFLGVAKRYAGLLKWKKGKECNDMKVVGFERTDIMDVVNDLLSKVFYYILHNDVKKAISVYKDTLENIDKFDLDYIAIRKGLGKNVDEYKTNSPIVRGVRFAEKHLGKKFTAGSKPKMLYVKRCCGVKTDVVCYEKASDLKDVVVDYDKHIKLIKSAVEPVIDAVSINSLRRWFS